MEVKKGAEIELGCLQELDFADVNLRDVNTAASSHRRPFVDTYVLERVDSLGSLLNLAADNLRDELGGKLGKGAARGLTLDDLSHLPADGSDLGRSSVGGLLDLVGAALGEGDREEAEEVVIGRLDGDVGLD